MHSVVSGLTGRVIRTRRQLLSDLEGEVAMIDSLICDEAFSFGRMLTSEAEKVTRQLRDFKASPILSQKINSKCTDWINESISNFYAGVQNAREYCGRYEQVEMDSQPERVRESLATELFNVIERLSKLHPNASGNSSLDELSRTRLCLALLHCDSTSFCQAMNKDGERIAAASRLLNAAAEDSLRYRWFEWESSSLFTINAVS
ncbi:hypothetical protein TELCIR_10471 [Teladorsagia circumcincta]|uniref:Uncharacterized protein n=1 Tax=Teladorsagia circumcincta TaxID=45464 RepID=A0A2G9UC09_TELCI|nr:hypothetical protein TELCIR_10471 [Teladorsagia circumcincta]